MSKRPVPFDDSFDIGDGFTRWAAGTNGYDDGEVILPEGIVTVLMQGDDRNRPLTRLDAVINGRLVIRTYEKRYSRRGVVRLARQLLREGATVSEKHNG